MGECMSLAVLTYLVMTSVYAGPKNFLPDSKAGRIQIWVPDPVDVDLIFSDQNRKKKKDIPTGKLIDSAVLPKRKSANVIRRQLKFDETAPKKTKGSMNTDDNDAMSPLPTMGLTPVDSSGDTVAFPKWYPVCLFADETLDAGEVNSGVKGLTDAGAACGVNVIVFPITMRTGYGESPDPINSATVNWCNVSEIGANNGSATACVPYARSADLMCGDTKGSGIAGCASGRGQEEQRKIWQQRNRGRTLNTSGEGAGPSGGSDGVLPSIEDGGACDSGLVNHESIGHSALGWPNKEQSEAGFGIEDVGGSGNGSGSSWSTSACARLSEVATPNDGRWRYDRNRQTYYVRAKEPIDLLSGGTLFERPAPPPSGPPRILANTGAPTEEVFSSGFFSDRKLEDSPVANLGAATDPERHKKGAIASAGFDEGMMGKKTQARSDFKEPSVGAVVPSPPTGVGKSSSQSLTFDEGISKNPPSNTTLGNATSKKLSTGSNNDVSESLGYDESAPEGGSTVSTESKRRESRSTTTGGKSSSIEPRLPILRRPNKELDPEFFGAKRTTNGSSERKKGASLRKPEE